MCLASNSGCLNSLLCTKSRVMEGVLSILGANIAILKCNCNETLIIKVFINCTTGPFWLFYSYTGINEHHYSDTAMILSSTLDKVQRPSLQLSTSHLPTHKRLHLTPLWSRRCQRPRGLGQTPEEMVWTGPLWCLNQRPSKGQGAFSRRLINPPPTTHTRTAQVQEREEKDTHTETSGTK